MQNNTRPKQHRSDINAKPMQTSPRVVSYLSVCPVGAQSGNQRFELIYTDYEDISLTSSVARTGVTTNNKIEADLDTIAFKYSYVF